jgi:hypothetical protein
VKRHPLLGALVVFGVQGLIGCGSTPTGATAVPTAALTPLFMGLSGPGQSAPVSVTFSGGSGNSLVALRPSDVSFAAKASGTSIFSISKATVSGETVSATVTGTGTGIDDLDVVVASSDPDFEDFPPMSTQVSVYPGGTWKGDVTLAGTSCNPSGSARYGETLVVSVSNTGSGTMTMKDAFDRAYSVTFSTAWLQGTANATSSAAFSTYVVPTSGAITLSRSGPTQISSQETISFPNCFETYTGTLTLQQ